MVKIAEEFQRQVSLAVFALRKCEFRYGMHVFVTGCCGTAILVGAVAKQCGAASVLLAVKGGERDEQARKLGFNACRYDENLEEVISRVTNRRGFDLSFETSGEKESYTALLKAAKRGGTVGVLADLNEPYSFFVKTAIRSQIRFIGINSFDEESVQFAGNLLRDGKLDDVVSALNSGIKEMNAPC